MVINHKQKIFVQKKLSKKNSGKICVQKKFSKKNFGKKILSEKFLVRIFFWIETFLSKQIFCPKKLIKKNLVQRKFSPQNCWLDYFGYFS